MMATADEKPEDNEGAIPDRAQDGVSGPPSLEDLIVESTVPRAGSAANDPTLALADFLSARSIGRALHLAGAMPASASASKQSVLLHLSRLIALLDELISEQVNTILHHPRFQRLEASWRGLRYLIDQVDPDSNIRVRLLNATWKELATDAERAGEFDQTQLFRKVYSEEYDRAGGEPFGLLLGDFFVRHRPGKEHPIDDLPALTAISQVASAAFAPFITSVAPALFGLSDLGQLERGINLERIFSQTEYLKWNAFRATEDARFIGLTLPRILLRLPYEDDGSWNPNLPHMADGRRIYGFRFREDVSGDDQEKYLWGNAAFAFGAVVVRAFAKHGWLADIRGFQRDDVSGGIVSGLPIHYFSTDQAGVAPKAAVEVTIPESHEKSISDLGFIPLCYCHDTEYCAFFSNQSMQKSKHYDRALATVNARLSSMIQYVLCVARFAHYLKALGRSKIGSFIEPEELQDSLGRWLAEYTTSDDNASYFAKARYPLNEADVKVRPNPHNPGSYFCVMYLKPHFQFDNMVAGIRLTTELSDANAR